MEDYEYKVIPAPVRTVKVKGLKTTGERFAHLMTEALNREAEAGWEFLRAETLPCEERKGLMSKARSTQTVLIFRRPLDLPEEPAAAGAPRREPRFDQASDPLLLREDSIATAPAPHPSEPDRHPVPSFRAGPRMGKNAPTGDEARARREPTLRAPRQGEEDR